MSCTPAPTTPDTDSSDYGSDFTPDEEQILNDLLAQAVAEHASATVATASTAPPPATANATTTVAAAELVDLNSLNPVKTADIVADIEDGLESAPGVRVPKVLGREMLRSPRQQRQSSQPFRSYQTSQGPDNNGDCPFGEILFPSGVFL